MTTRTRKKNTGLLSPRNASFESPRQKPAPNSANYTRRCYNLPMQNAYYRVMLLRLLLLLAAWGIVLYSMFFVPSVHIHTLAFRPGEDDYAGWLVILSDVSGLFFRLVKVSGITMAPESSTQYFLLVVSDLLGSVAHFCFALTPIAVIPLCRNPAARPSFSLFIILPHFHLDISGREPLLFAKNRGMATQGRILRDGYWLHAGNVRRFD